MAMTTTTATSAVSSAKMDDLIQTVSLHNPRKLLFNGYVLPFVIIEAIWIYCWICVYGTEDYFDEGLIGIAVIGVLQIFTCLCCQWSVHVHCFLNCSSTKDPYKSTIAKVVPMPNNGSSELVKLCRDKDNKPWFIFQKTKYVWSVDKKQFQGLEFPVDKVISAYRDWKGYQDDIHFTEAEEHYGKNKLDMVVPEFSKLFKERAIAPFFVFQVFCVALWCLDQFWYYSIFTLVMLIMFECTLVQQQMRNMAEIRKMGNKPYMMMVYRNRRWRQIFSDQLIPGDIVSITRSHNDNLVPCDILLLRGPCVVDESMLTGESVPQMKEPVEEIDGNEELNIEGEHKLHVLFGGTKVVQHTPPIKNSSGLRATDNGCVGYVLRTGFSTSQGRLLRTILFGVKRVTANNLETFCFILFLLVFAIAAAAYLWIKGSEDPKRNRYKLFLECTLILTSVVPPELPIELSLAVNTSLLALSKLGIFCTEPFRIPFAGKIEICCFDKTGTLTSDKLIVEGVAGIDGDMSVQPIDKAPKETIQVLATCHSLVQIDEGIVGDPLEKVTLDAVNWNLTKGDAVIPKKGKGHVLKIFYRHHFSSALKRMCVVSGYSLTSASSEMNYIVTVKGAPETLKSMGLSYLKEEDGGLLHKLLPHVVIFARCAPKQKEFIIISLQDLGYTTLMCGDGTNDVGALKHSQVGVAILSIPPQQQNSEKIAVSLATSSTDTNRGGKNGGRHQNSNKTPMKIPNLLQELEEQDSATIVKLGDASIAAPFTSKLSSILCICHVIKQGRCTLVTTLQMFKILALNALVLAYSQSVLYTNGIKFSDAQASVQGLLLAACFLFISRSKPLKTLSKQRPLPNIFNVYTVMTVMLQFAVHFFCLIYLVQEATLFSSKSNNGELVHSLPPEDAAEVISAAIWSNEDKPYEVNLLNSTVYIISMALQVSTFAINYRGQPFMEGFMENKGLLYSLLGSSALILGLVLGYFPSIAFQLEILEFPHEFRSTLLQVLVVNFIAAGMVDRACRCLFGEDKIQIMRL
ncbi:endoplasmic reticulum transmembrane helix translocase isoform X4 [Venturia canescens]|uniref:endoplasmic reticulum transmembrane helix translocase isoform X4 n=1 Tax=Venturia canescens TaxID=32260 RepID=UPI001C9BC9A0|nr:endoplasmic reticulum transmembrane helix translocase isoform X4 [Venturia canescens]